MKGYNKSVKNTFFSVMTCTFPLRCVDLFTFQIKIPLLNYCSSFNLLYYFN